MTLAETIARARVGTMVVPAPDMATLVARGPDRLTWLNGLVTCELAKLKEGEAIYGLTVAKKGRIVSDLVVVGTKDSLVVVVPARLREELRQAFDHYLVMEDVELGVGEEEVWFAHGPRSAEVHVGTTAPLDLTGLGGAILLVPTGSGPAIEARAKELGGCVGDDAAWEALRLEQGVPRFGPDFDSNTYPQEASLEARAVSFDKGCYLGQEVVCMLELRGQVKRKLVPVTLSASAPVGTTVVDEGGKEVGQVTSVAFGPTRNEYVGLAMIKRAVAVPGSVLRAGDAVVSVR